MLLHILFQTPLARQKYTWDLSKYENVDVNQIWIVIPLELVYKYRVDFKATPIIKPTISVDLFLLF